MENARPITLLITSADRTVPITVQQRSRLAPADSMALIGPIDLSRVSILQHRFPASPASPTRPKRGITLAPPEIPNSPTDPRPTSN
jgi:hypothetical protein